MRHTLSLAARRSTVDFHLPFQVLRHSFLAKKARQGIYTLVMGKEGYPFVFRHVEEHEDFSGYSSPHLYIHVPFCRSICPHCPYNKVIFRQASYEAYARALEREVRCYLAQKDIPPIETLYFGGGTPSMTPDLIEQIIALTRATCTQQVEIGVEVHPVDATVRRLEQLKQCGVNRISLGIETFQDELLKTLGRGYTGEQAEQAILNAIQVGFACVDVNLMYGMPGQSGQDSLNDVRRCIALGVDHLSAYPLMTFEHTRLGTLVRNGTFKEVQYLFRRRIHETHRAKAGHQTKDERAIQALTLALLANLQDTDRSATVPKTLSS